MFWAPANFKSSQKELTSLWLWWQILNYLVLHGLYIYTNSYLFELYQWYKTPFWSVGVAVKLGLSGGQLFWPLPLNISAIYSAVDTCTHCVPIFCSVGVAVCMPPKQQDNGKWTPEKPSYNIGATVWLNCATGFKLTDSSISSATCGKDTQWSSPSPTCQGKSIVRHYGITYRYARFGLFVRWLKKLDCKIVPNRPFSSCLLPLFAKWLIS